MNRKEIPGKLIGQMIIANTDSALIALPDFVGALKASSTGGEERERRAREDEAGSALSIKIPY